MKSGDFLTVGFWSGFLYIYVQEATQGNSVVGMGCPKPSGGLGIGMALCLLCRTVAQV